MRSRNGVSREFRFIIDGITILDFSFKHKALEEWTQEQWVVNTTIGGVWKQKFLHLYYFFRIDWSELIVGPDADKLQIVRNAEFQNKKLELVPHIDLPDRYFEVVTTKDQNGNSEQINFSQTVNQPYSQGNQNTIVIFRTPRPQHFWDIRDPSVQTAISTLSTEEFI